MSDFLAELKWRGLFNQCTDEGALAAHLASGDPAAGGRRAYIGFDPTADSLTIGNFVQMMVLAHFQRAGHTPVAVMGGGTGLIGDPSGKSAERQLNTEEIVRANVEAQRVVFARVLDFDAKRPNAARQVNNLDWLGKISYLHALRDIGKHFSVNMMIQKDSVRERLHNRDQGISYTEFSYMVLQAYDFLHLWEHEGVTLQMGGSDQWGNIVAGADLVRRRWGQDRAAAHEAEADAAHAPMAFGLTVPLLMKADGGKFGKTEKGAIWLTAPKAGETSPNRTTPYALYQYLLNLADADVGKFLRIFTFMTREEVEDVEARHAADAGQRIAQRTVARSIVTMLHGEHEATAAERAAAALFSGEIDTLSEATMREVFADAPGSTMPRARLEGTSDAPGVDLIDLLVETGLAQSRKQAKEFLATKAVTINGRPAPDDHRLRTQHLLHGSMTALRRGKKNWHLVEWK
ncbi:MAG: tyrosine--tRNA ligase [Phycisphaerales bacterium]